MEGNDPPKVVVRGAHKRGLDVYFYAAQLVHLRQKWWLLATIHDDRSQRICRPIEVYVDATGIHPVA